MSPTEGATRPASSRSPPSLAARARTDSAIANNPRRVFHSDRGARRNLREAPALLSDRECLTYRALAERSNRYSRWALDQGLAKVTRLLIMPNRLSTWQLLGLTRVGCVVACSIPISPAPRSSIA